MVVVTRNEQTISQREVIERGRPGSVSSQHDNSGDSQVTSSILASEKINIVLQNSKDMSSKLVFY